MESQRPFRVIIIGGGIAGLTLALMLERFDVDYVLLESHEQIAPAVGASIAIVPYGFLILDQLGCFEAVQEAAHPGGWIDGLEVRTHEGKSLLRTKEMNGHFQRRHGYPVLFLDRQKLLEILYSRVQHKDRIICQSRISSIDESESEGSCGIRATTSDGAVYEGDLLVGADGIRSVVRQEMRRLAGPAHWDQEEESRVPCHYQCSFGIAADVQGWPERMETFTMGQDRCFLTASGPDNKCYWFLFNRLPESEHGEDITRYTREDEAAMVQKYSHLRITETITFGQIYEKRLASTLTSLHDYIFKKWYHGRMVIIGDSAHKPNPIGGAGGNGAIESAAELVNALLAVRDARRDGLQGLSTADVESISKAMQDARSARAQTANSMSTQMQGLFACEWPLVSRFISRVIFPLAGDEYLIEKMGDRFIGGARLNHLPIPARGRVDPFDCELPSRPLHESHGKYVKGVFALGMGAAMWFWGRQSLSTPIGDTAQLIAPMLIYTVEGYRVGHQGSLLGFPSAFGLGIFAKGLGFVAPVHALIRGVQCVERPAGRSVEPNVAKALVPALALSCLSLAIPYLLSLSAEVPGRSYWEILSRLTPLIFPILTGFIASIFRGQGPKLSDDEARFDRYKDADVPILQRAYWTALVAQALLPLVKMTIFSSDPVVALTDLFSTASITSIISERLFSSTDVIPGTLLAQNLYSVWDLRRLGYVTTLTAIKTSVSVVAGQVLAGSGATWLALWSWREGVVSGLSTLNRPYNKGYAVGAKAANGKTTQR